MPLEFAKLPTLETDRLILRGWQCSDLASFADMNADPEVMKFFPSTRTQAESDQWVANLQGKIRETGFGPHVVSIKGGADFIGFVGLSKVMFEAEFTPAIEIGWRLSREAWGNGYASEAAREALCFGFVGKGLEDIVSFAPKINLGSIGVMQKIGMKQDTKPEFIHPSLDANSPLNPCVLYRAQKADFGSGL